MSVSQFQITLDGEEDMLDSLDLICKNVEECLKTLNKRLKTLKKPLIDLAKNEDLKTSNKNLLILSKFYESLNFYQILPQIFTKTSLYLSKNCANNLLKLIQSESEDNLPEFLHLQQRIWSISRKNRLSEDKIQELQEQNALLTQSYRCLELHFKELNLESYLLQIEIDTQSACLTSLQWHRSSS